MAWYNPKSDKIVNTPVQHEIGLIIYNQVGPHNPVLKKEAICLVTPLH